MKKYIISIISLIFIILIGIYFFSLTDIKKDIKSEFGLISGKEKEWTQAFKEYEIIQCKFGFLKAEYVFVSHRDYSYRDEDRELWKTTFYNTVRSHIFSPNWQIEYTGGTTVKNTTFPELVKMVKEDCSQFQKSKGNHTDETINWSYSSYTPEPVLTEEEQRAKDRRELVESLRLELAWYTEEELKELEDEYGIVKRSMDKDFIEWNNKVKLFETYIYE